MGASDLIYDQLMTYVQNAYDTRIQDQDKPWLTKSKDLQEFESLKVKNAELQKE